jgi:hypothetical protein
MHPIRSGAALLLVLPAVGHLLASCGDPGQTERLEYPRLELSAEMVEFNTVEQAASATRTVWLSNLGDLPMGIAALDMGTSDRSDPSFSVSWSLDDLACPESADVDDTGAEEPPDGVIAVLGPDCRLPVQVSFTPDALGTLWGSFIVRTGTEDLAEGDNGEPAFYSDPLHAKRIVTLVGEGERGIANLMVQPRRHDYGHLRAGAAERAYIALSNIGDGELTLQEPYLEGCADSFAITGLGSEGSHAVLEPGISSFVEVTYSPDSTDAASCTLVVESDDTDSPRVEVALEANTGADPDNEPPTVVIRSPEVGHRWSGGEADALRLQLNIFDLDQPADTLTCRVKSMVQADGASVAHCEADDASGHVWVDVPYAYVGAGVDTLKVQVTDSSEIIAYASISVLWNEGFPGSDDDGDGWGEASDVDDDGNFDCDDHNAATYPYAAELADGLDNDCDGVVDEGTLAYDDDGDSFSEDEGDCNDHDDEVYVGAREVADYKDNDCDGVIDEGSSLYDDDGDGYSELDQDCNDEDAEVHPGAVEYCDGIDNDCNQLRDYSDGCIEIDAAPYVVGGIDLQQTACEPGDALQVSVLAFDADGQDLDYAWTGDEGLIIEPLTGSPSVTVTCPEPSSASGSVLDLIVYITDEDQNAVWAFDELWVYPAGDLYRPYVRVVSP